MVDILNIALPEMLHQQGSAVRPLRGQQQMRMIGHQHVGVYSATKFGGEFLKVMQVELAILLGIETNRAVIAALDNVPGDIGDGKAGAAGHGESITSGMTAC